MSMSDAFLPEGGRDVAPHNDPIEREDVDLDDETSADSLSDDVVRGTAADDEAPTRDAAFRTPTGASVDPADD
jgi:hypothetical protein